MVYYLTDIKKIQFGSLFRYAGANAITVFFLSSFIAKLFGLIKINENTSVHSWLFNTIYVHEFMSMQMSSLLYAILLKGLLEEAGIAFIEKNEQNSGVISGFVGGTQSTISVSVQEFDKEKAEKIVSEFKERAKSD